MAGSSTPAIGPTPEPMAGVLDPAIAYEYASHRAHSGAASAALRARYRPVGPIFLPRPDTVEHFLTERYCLYALDGSGRLICGEIHHPPWPLQRAEAEFERNTMTEPLDI